MLRQREQDHRRWLAELEASVAENRPFALTTDPHACAFGRWYDSFHTDDPWLAAAVRKLDTPHRKIHGLGLEVTALVTGGDKDAAAERLKAVRNADLAALIRLFGEITVQYRQSRLETAVVLRCAAGLRVISVDAVDAVERIASEQMSEVPVNAATAGGVVCGIARRAQSSDLILLLDPERI